MRVARLTRFSPKLKILFAITEMILAFHCVQKPMIFSVCKFGIDFAVGMKLNTIDADKNFVKFVAHGKLLPYQDFKF
jgi:hypothetical protein